MQFDNGKSVILIGDINKEIKNRGEEKRDYFTTV
jgi:hypothetical protein